jgi:hypothetical protein
MRRHACLAVIRCRHELSCFLAAGFYLTVERWRGGCNDGGEVDVE